MTVIDWGRYQKCGSCGALLGKPCYAMTGSSVVLKLKPCGTRRMRTGYSRAGEDRG